MDKEMTIFMYFSLYDDVSGSEVDFREPGCGRMDWIHLAGSGTEVGSREDDNELQVPKDVENS
jgi:hypothetical protein